MKLNDIIKIMKPFAATASTPMRYKEHCRDEMVYIYGSPKGLVASNLYAFLWVGVPADRSGLIRVRPNDSTDGVLTTSLGSAPALLSLTPVVIHKWELAIKGHEETKHYTFDDFGDSNLRLADIMSFTATHSKIIYSVALEPLIKFVKNKNVSISTIGIPDDSNRNVLFLAGKIKKSDTSVPFVASFSLLDVNYEHNQTYDKKRVTKVLNSIETFGGVK